MRSAARVESCREIDWNTDCEAGTRVRLFRVVAVTPMSPMLAGRSDRFAYSFARRPDVGDTGLCVELGDVVIFYATRQRAAGEGGRRKWMFMRRSVWPDLGGAACFGGCDAGVGAEA